MLKSLTVIFRLDLNMFRSVMLFSVNVWMLTSIDFSGLVVECSFMRRNSIKIRVKLSTVR